MGFSYVPHDWYIHILRVICFGIKSIHPILYSDKIKQHCADTKTRKLYVLNFVNSVGLRQFLVL